MRTSVDVYDALALIGFTAVLAGVSCWSLPATLVLAGAVLMLLAIWPDLRRAHQTRVRRVAGG